MKHSWFLSIVLVTLAAGLISVTGWATAGSPTESVLTGPIPAELSDKDWVNRNPSVAPDIKKIQLTYRQDPVQGLQTAASALRHREGVVRAYAALVLGAIGTSDQLLLLDELTGNDPDPAVRGEAELAALRIRVRLAGSHAEKQVSVLAPAFKSSNRATRLWAAHTLAANPSASARALMQDVLAMENDPAVRAELTGK